ncbi:DUF4365 domain-containing protein [Streptomyces sp. NPDC052051]|uniref:DUF4365 domain-containing protein n=1 Tax=Streptomyces sp. NPDC052051 TaxID=3154649 RepID=UPI003415807A
MTDSTTGGIPLQSSQCAAACGIPVPEQNPAWVHASTGFGENGHRGDFGEQFVRMLAAAANIDAARRERDRVGVDWQLGHPGRPGTRRFPLIEAQVKCTSSPEVHDKHIAYDLKAKNYNQLAGRDYSVPRFLFLVLAPGDPVTWSDATPDRLLLRHAAYWTCLHGLEPYENPPRNGMRRVHVPRANLLTVGSLHDLFSTGSELLGVS